MALTCLVLVGGGLLLGQLPALWAGQGAKDDPDFRVASLLKVSREQPRLMFATNEGQVPFDVYRRTQVVHIKSRPVLNAALRNPKVAELKLIKNQDDPLEWLAQNIRVDFIDDSEIMRIAVRGKPSEELVTLVNAITDAYLTEVVNKEQNNRLRRVDQLKELLTRQESSLREKRKVLRGLAEQVGTSNTNNLSAKQKATLELLTQTRLELARTRSEMNKKQIELLVAQSLQKEADEAAVPDALVAEEIKRDQIVKRHLDRIADLEWEAEKAKLDTADGENSPEVKKLRQGIKAAEAALEARKKKLGPTLVAELRQRARARRQEETAGLKDRLAYLKKLIEVLEGQEKALDDGDRRLNQGFLDLEAYKEEIVQAEAVARRIQAEIQAMEVELKAPPRVIALETATMPAAK
jgi:hypothetical protein